MKYKFMKWLKKRGIFKQYVYNFVRAENFPRPITNPHLYVFYGFGWVDTPEHEEGYNFWLHVHDDWIDYLDNVLGEAKR